MYLFDHLMLDYRLVHTRPPEEIISMGLLMLGVKPVNCCSETHRSFSDPCFESTHWFYLYLRPELNSCPY